MWIVSFVMFMLSVVGAYTLSNTERLTQSDVEDSYVVSMSRNLVTFHDAAVRTAMDLANSGSFMDNTNVLEGDLGAYLPSFFHRSGTQGSGALWRTQMIEGIPRHVVTYVVNGTVLPGRTNNSPRRLALKAARIIGSPLGVGIVQQSGGTRYVQQVSGTITDNTSILIENTFMSLPAEAQIGYPVRYTTIPN